MQENLEIFDTLNRFRQGLLSAMQWVSRETGFIEERDAKQETPIPLVIDGYLKRKIAPLAPVFSDPRSGKQASWPSKKYLLQVFPSVPLLGSLFHAIGMFFILYFTYLSFRKECSCSIAP